MCGVAVSIELQFSRKLSVAPPRVAAVLLFLFSSRGSAGWDVSSGPSIREGMPVLIDDDLLLEDEYCPRPAAVINQWLRELPINGAHSPRTWQAYAFAVKSWAEFLTSHNVSVLASRQDLRDGLSLYAQHRLSGEIDNRLSSSSWNMAVKIIAAFYRWAMAERHIVAEPFSYASQTLWRSDGSKVEVPRNLATLRTANAHTGRKYLEQSFVDLLMDALAGKALDGSAAPRFRGYETGRNVALVGFALSTGLRAQEFAYLTVYEVPPLPARRSSIPIPVPLAPPTTKGGKGRSTWVDFDALSAVHTYMAIERAAAVAGSSWSPADALQIEEPTHDGARINGAYRRWSHLTVQERRRLVCPGGGSALVGVRRDGAPFTDWATVLRRTSVRIRKFSEPGFPHVHPHMLRHTFAMRTLERLVKGYYQQAARLLVDTGGDDAMSLYLTKADPLLVLRDLLGHSSVETTQAYLHLLDTQRVFQDAYDSARPSTSTTGSDSHDGGDVP